LSLTYTASERSELSDEEFLILFDIHKSKNPDFPYWIYNNFDLLVISEAECWAEFRMYRNDVILLKNVFNIPDTIRFDAKTEQLR